jgi:Ran GTPase-activating protein (RanGAP) involved in mRNA processing and transport
MKQAKIIKNIINTLLLTSALTATTSSSAEQTLSRHLVGDRPFVQQPMYLTTSHFFNEVLQAVQNNSISTIDTMTILDLEKDQLVQLLSELKNNTSVTILTINNSSDYFKVGQADIVVVNALIDLLANNTTLKEIDISSYQKNTTFETESIKKILNAVNDNIYLTHFGLEGWNFKLPAMRYIANYIAENKTVTSLALELYSSDKLDCNNECAQGAKLIAQAFAENNTIEWLNFWTGKSSGDAGVMQELARALTQNNTIKFLLIKHFPIDVSAAKLFSQAIAQNSSLKYFYLENNNMPDDAMQALIPGITQNANLLRVDFWGQYLTKHETVTQLLNSFAQKSLVHFGLGYSTTFAFDKQDAKIIADKLRNDTTIQSLSFIYEGISNEVITPIADALRKNTSLKELDVRVNNIGVDGVKALAASLEDNHSLYWIGVDDDILQKALTPAELQLFYQRLERNAQGGR